jgi:hypothetical protein
MPAAITTLRSTLAAVLANPGVWQTFSYPPATVLANSVIVAPADGDYIVPASSHNAVNLAPLANFKIVCTTVAYDNQGNLNALEEFMVAVYNKLENAAFPINIGNVSAPVVFTGQSGELLSFQINISTLTQWS